MGRLLALCAGILVLATFIPVAWPQEAPTPAAPEDPLANAIAVVKAPAAAKASDIADARNYLVEQRQVARPLIVQLLGDADPQVRMNAAIVLAEMANVGDTSPATLQALQTAAKDKEFAVAYWGFEGLMSNGVPAADQTMVISEMMKLERPRALRLAALTTIGEKKPMAAAPIIVSHLQEILNEYTAQVETVVTSAETIQRPGLAPGVPSPLYAPPSGFPRPTYAPPSPSSPATGLPPGASRMPPNFRGPGSFAGAQGQGGAQAAFMAARGFGRGQPTPAAAPVTPTPAGAPVAPTLAETYRAVAQVRRADLPNLTLDRLQALVHTVEDMTLVTEVHQMGLVLEDIVTNNSPPGTELFDFRTTPPWDLDKCVDKAVIYMNSHRAEYGAAPETPQPPAAPTPAVPPEAAPATGTAPATTAATPATTTPAP